MTLQDKLLSPWHTALEDVTAALAVRGLYGFGSSSRKGAVWSASGDCSKEQRGSVQVTLRQLTPSTSSSALQCLNRSRVVERPYNVVAVAPSYRTYHLATSSLTCKDKVAFCVLLELARQLSY
jgi:hypothetical protein